MVAFKALVARELTEMLVREEETEDDEGSVDSSEVLSLPLLVLIECEGDLDSDRIGLNTRLFRFLEEAAAAVALPTALRLIDEGNVTDSKMRECASLGVNLGARNRGLLLCRSNLVPD